VGAPLFHLLTLELDGILQKKNAHIYVVFIVDGRANCGGLADYSQYRRPFGPDESASGCN
jgi:hypothetical protein